MQRRRAILARNLHFCGIRRNACTQSRRLITRRSQVQILPPLLRKALETGSFCWSASFRSLHLQAVVGYLTESPGFSTFVHDDGAVYHTYSTTWRGLEFLMGYDPILDHAPKGRDEGEAWQLWIRRHDEYQNERNAVDASRIGVGKLNEEGDA
jgi:predicted dithiol-disulfide oxidoreductase (DUF899 family)